MLEFQAWGEDGRETVLVPEEQRIVESAFLAMERAFSAMLAIGRGGRALIIGANRWRFQVTALLGEDDTYELVGAPGVVGFTPLGLGGQGAPFPRRYIVSAAQARAAACEFFRTGEVAIDRRWEHQRDPASAWFTRVSIDALAGESSILVRRRSRHKIAYCISAEGSAGRTMCYSASGVIVRPSYRSVVGGSPPTLTCVGGLLGRLHTTEVGGRWLENKRR